MKAYSAILVFALIGCAFADGGDGPSNLCAKPPDSVLQNLPVWQTGKAPVRDHFDQFMVNKTGCRYVSLKAQETHEIKRVYNGTPLQVNFAVRGYYLDAFTYSTKPAINPIYYNVNGLEGKTECNYIPIGQGYLREVERQSTPKIIETTKYTPFYTKIDAGTITFGKICETEPSLQPISLEIQPITDIEVSITLYSNSPTGYGLALLVC